MKRKLSALLSLVLAVVMVFPMGIGVSADTTPTNTYTGKFKITVDGDPHTTGTDYEVSVGTKFAISVEVDDGVTVACSVNDTAAVGNYSRVGDTNTFEFEGRIAGKSANITFTASKAQKEGDPLTASQTITVAATKPAITTFKNTSIKDVVVKYSVDGGTPITHSYTDDITYEPNQKISNAEISGTFDNDKTFTVNNVKVNTDDDFSDRTKTYNEVTIVGGDEKLYFQFDYTLAFALSALNNAEDVSFEYDDVIIERNITGQGRKINSVAISRNSNKSFQYNEGFSELATSDLKVEVTYQSLGATTTREEDNFTIVGLYSSSTAQGAINKALRDDTSKSDAAQSFDDHEKGENVYIVITYEGQYFAENCDILDFTNPIPLDVHVHELYRTAKKQYITGQTFGCDGFTGVEIHVYYGYPEDLATFQPGTITDHSDCNIYRNDKKEQNSSSDILGIQDLRGTLTFSPFSASSPLVTFIYEEEVNNSKFEGSFFTSSSTIGITVLEDELESLEIASQTGVKKSYTSGDVINLSGLKLNLVYTSGRKVGIGLDDPNLTISPAIGTEIGMGTTSIELSYKVTDNISLPATLSNITVSPKPVVQEPEPETKVKEVLLIDTYGVKEYYTGEKFDTDGYVLLVTYNDNTPSRTIDLDECRSVSVVKNSYYDSSFLKKASNLSITVSFKLPTDFSDNTTWSVTVDGIEVTKRPILQSFSVYSTKTEYWVGDAPRVCDFSIIAKYDEGPDRTFTVEYDDDDRNTYGISYDSNDDDDYEEGIRREIDLSPSRIDADTKKITVTYTETLEGVRYKKTAEFEIDKVNIPDAIVSYRDPDNGGATTTKSFEDVYNAILFAIEMRQETESKYYSYPPEVELQRDATLDYSVNTRYSFDIDLNGHSLTMIRGDLDIASSGTADTEIIISNTDRNDGKLVFSNDEEDTVIIAYRDTFTIDADSNSEGKYDVTITTPKNGKVTGPDEVTHGRDAQFTITADEGYEIASIKVNNKTKTADNEGKLVVSDVQEKLTVTVTFKEKAWDCPFTDVYKSASYYRAIQFVYENELFQGTSATKFEPDTTMTRAMFVTVLGRLAKVNVNNYSTMSFTDVKNSAATSWYVPYVEWAASIGLVEGYGNGKFGPDDPITHAQMYVLMQRYALLVEKLATNATGTSIPANDVRDVPEWAVDAVRYAAKKDFLVLSSNRLTPNANAKRSELAVLLNDFCENVLGWDK